MSNIELIEVSPTEIELIEIQSAGVTVIEKNSEFSWVCGQTLSGHKAVTFNATGGLIYADKDTPVHGCKVAGITTHAAEMFQFCRVLRHGEITEPSWFWDVNLPVFVGNSGELTQTPPVTGFSVIIGFPIRTDTLSVRIQTTVYLEE